MNIVKIRKQGNDVTITLPKELNIPVCECKKDNFNFDEYLLQDLFAKGYFEEELIVEFEQRKGKISKAVQQLAKEVKNESIISGRILNVKSDYKIQPNNITKKYLKKIKDKKLKQLFF
ncbi:MAG: hypothetical protein LBS28_00005 [Streptococcaceae bacterium]|jgi:hypothetical protein|nr:hypothetical protein [Streptococcaceae bacterium]